MIPFDYHRATDVEDAVRTAAARPDAAYLAGGTNLVDHLRLGITSPGLLVDVSRLPFDDIDRLADGGVRVGAGVRNSDLAAHPAIRRDYPMLAAALLAGASWQLRNLATTGGNLLQRTRCAYFQNPATPCNKREPGSGCSALAGWQRHHAILGASEHCVAVHPSDMAVPLAALDATVRITGPGGNRGVPLTAFHRLPGDEPQRDTVLDHGELITAVDLPRMPPTTRSAYRKVRDRASYAFALVSVAATLTVTDGVVRDARIALGGVAHKPWRATRAEETLRGAAARAESFRAAAEAELAEAEPLPGSAFKTTMVREALVSVLTGLAEGRPR
ncbi:FAD binding domain-containing protein [Actinoalloteichus spitiensis]|uniref:FAD binding domain-containing protein n=1 Tax=Actinoalloteichus spitiensis TaxID=252394 RepID=UPI000375E893|nr:xanthine dehydrogenase family protein subunit M [Actinoalloteichus spitiensis]